VSVTGGDRSARPLLRRLRGAPGDAESATAMVDGPDLFRHDPGMIRSPRRHVKRLAGALESEVGLADLRARQELLPGSRQHHPS
jgi:hypothetical protein